MIERFVIDACVKLLYTVVASIVFQADSLRYTGRDSTGVLVGHSWIALPAELPGSFHEYIRYSVRQATNKALFLFMNLHLIRIDGS